MCLHSAHAFCGVLYYQPVWVCRGSGQHQTDSLVYSQSSRGWTGRYQLLYLVISKDCDQVSGRLLPCIGRRVAEQFGRALGPSTSGFVWSRSTLIAMRDLSKHFCSQWAHFEQFYVCTMYAWDQVVVINRDWERVEAGDWKDLFHVARPRLRTRPVCLFVNHFISRVGNEMECSVLHREPLLEDCLHIKTCHLHLW